jgi:protein-tyrosine phosphatase/nicotinamidase-related amidase
MRSILITDCLQYDFVGPIGRFDALPNALHVGHEESLRLLGPVVEEGPVARTIAWAHSQPDDRLTVIHVRDWHDDTDAEQRSHLTQFGLHCVRDSAGASFVFRTDGLAPGKELRIIDATGLSNFVGANLDPALQGFRNEPVRVGLMGVWTEAKITYLAYDLRARYPHFEIAVCSALTASSSRQNHFLALDQMERILGVRVLPSVGEFVDYLGGSMAEAPLIGFSHKHPELTVADGTTLRETDRQLVRYLFRGCRVVRVKSLDGGFSGNAVLATQSIDLQGHEQVPHVVKIGERGPIGQERESFERIEAVLGNSAPRVADFADMQDRGAIKYRYAAMGRGTSASFQKLYEAGLPLEQVQSVLDAVFADQLGRFYRAAAPERVDLLEYYQFSSKWSNSVAAKVRAVMGEGAGEILEFPGGRRVPSVARFYEQELDQLPRRQRAHYVAQLHGDLNGANIIVDAQKNVWLIDFFHAHRGHVLKDLIKLENDLLYIWTKIETDQEFEDALALTDRLLLVEDLAAGLPEGGEKEFKSPKIRRAYAAVRMLRSYYPALVNADRDPMQLLIGQVRYAVHTLSFEEANPLQKRWALFAASTAAAQFRRKILATVGLRIDWLPTMAPGDAQVGLTWLPGRKDVGRILEEDLDALQASNVTSVICLLARDEFARYGVEGLLDAYRSRGIEVLHTPTLDGRSPSAEELHESVAWIRARFEQKRNVVIHCVGGIGRAGTVAACWLKSRGFTTDDAIAKVREIRSPRAVETRVQEEAIAVFHE